MKASIRFCSVLTVVAACAVTFTSVSGALPEGYSGKPFTDEVHVVGAQAIPGRVELAYYDLGGEGVAYHDTDATNNGSGVLNRDPIHLRPGIPARIQHFRENEGVDVSFTKDFADFNHPNEVDPPVNQLYIGWEEDGEWTNYTVNVRAPGRYRITTIYGFKDNRSTLSVNGVKKVQLLLPKDTGDWHYWTQAKVGEIVFEEAGLQLLTLHYNAGSNLAFLDFMLEEAFDTK
jgi:hypothetical protein